MTPEEYRASKQWALTYLEERNKLEESAEYKEKLSNYWKGLIEIGVKPNL